MKVRKWPIKEGKRPIKANGLFSGTPAVENSPSEKAHWEVYVIHSMNDCLAFWPRPYGPYIGESTHKLFGGNSGIREGLQTGPSWQTNSWVSLLFPALLVPQYRAIPLECERGTATQTSCLWKAYHWALMDYGNSFPKIYWWDHLEMSMLNNALTLILCNYYEIKFVVWPKGAM